MKYDVRVISSGGEPRFATDALVYHRNVPEGFSQWIARRRNLVGFPGLGNRSPLVADWFWHRHFLARETALFDLAVAAVVASLVARRPLLVLGVLPWARHRWPEARKRAGKDTSMRMIRLAQLWISDSVSLASLVEGSVKHRRLVV